MSTDGGTDRYAEINVTTATCDSIRGRTITATSVIAPNYTSKMQGVTPTPTGGSYGTLFQCQEGEVGILAIHQNSFTSASVGGIYVYNYLNGTGNVYMLFRYSAGVLVQFSGSVLQANNGNLSLLWRKTRIN